MNTITNTGDLRIVPVDNAWCQAIVELILPIQQIEFQVPITLAAQQDLLDIETFYHRQGGGFWGAFSGGRLIGTIALLDTGHHACALRKMFVKKEFRGREQGVAQRLLDTLIAYCRQKEITEIYLGTVDMLRAAHRFYEKNGFVRIPMEELPSYFPRMMADNIFYHLHLTATA